MISNPEFKTKYRNEQNQFYTQSLFYEYKKTADQTGVLYTLKEFDWEGYPSIKRLYLLTEDITEYLFANTYFEGWTHWKFLCNCEFLKPYIANWREELHLLFKCRALKNIKSLAEGTGSIALTANKILLDNNNDKSPGRPSNDNIRKEAEKITKDQDDIQYDFKRLVKEFTLPSEAQVLQSFSRTNQ